MIISLAQNKIQVAAEVAAHEQAWTDAKGVRGIPVRLEGEGEYGRHWDLTAVYDVLHRAIALQWQPTELIVWVRSDVKHYFGILRPGHSDESATQIDIVSSPDLDRLLLLAEAADGSTQTIPLLDGRAPIAQPVAWVVVCPSPDCPPQQAHPSRGEAEYFAGVHDRLEHKGSLTAEVAPAASITKVSPKVGWEVDGPDGTVLYLGWDVELAWELYHLAPAGAHLLPAQPPGESVPGELAEPVGPEAAEVEHLRPPSQLRPASLPALAGGR